MFCSACGSEMPLAAEVCPSCGHAAPLAPANASPRASAAGSASAETAERAGGSGAWARRVEEPHEPSETAAASARVAVATPRVASISARDLEQPGLPRDLPSRVALLTAVVMTVDLLIPWVTMRGESYPPASFGLAAALLVAPLAAVVAFPLFPQLRSLPLVRALPFAVGALALGFGGALWLVVGPVAAGLTTLDLDPFVPVAPAIGLDLFLLGACVLLVAGYFVLPIRRAP